MKLPSYITVKKVETPVGWKFAHFHASFKRCDNCGAEVAALSDPCGFGHLEKVLQFASDMRHKFDMTTEQLVALKDHYEKMESNQIEINYKPFPKLGNAPFHERVNWNRSDLE